MRSWPSASWAPVVQHWTSVGSPAGPDGAKMSFGHSPARHLQETKLHKTFSWNKGKSILFHTISPSHFIWLSLFLKSCSSYLELSSSTYSYVHILYLLWGSSELNTFPEKVVIFFCSNHHLSYADNGQQKIMWGIWMKYCTREGVENGHSNEKIAEKTSLFFSSLAKSAMNWCLVAVFFSLVLGSSVRKISGRLSRDCLEEYRGVFVIK